MSERDARGPEDHDASAGRGHALRPRSSRAAGLRARGTHRLVQGGGRGVAHHGIGRQPSHRRPRAHAGRQAVRAWPARRRAGAGRHRARRHHRPRLRRSCARPGATVFGQPAIARLGGADLRLALAAAAARPVPRRPSRDRAAGRGEPAHGRHGGGAGRRGAALRRRPVARRLGRTHHGPRDGPGGGTIIGAPPEARRASRCRARAADPRVALRRVVDRLGDSRRPRCRALRAPQGRASRRHGRGLARRRAWARRRARFRSGDRQRDPVGRAGARRAGRALARPDLAGLPAARAQSADDPCAAALAAGETGAA